ncbi:MAG: hypothetical protein ACR2OB_02030 [Solirubrobacteraceae bacterium]
MPGSSTASRIAGSLLAQRTGFGRSRIELRDAGGSVVGGFVPSGAFKRGGEVELQGRRLSWEPSSRWKSHFLLRDGERELAHFEARSSGKRPVKVRVEDSPSADELAVLFGCWLAKVAADDAMTAAAAASSVAATSV